MTDGRTDRRTDRRTDGRTDGGDCNIPNAFFKKRGDKKTTTHFQLNLSVLSYIKLLLVFIEFTLKGDK